MAQKELKLTTKTAAIIAIIVVVFVVFFATQGQTAKFYAAIGSPTRTTSGQVSIGVTNPPMQLAQPDLIPTGAKFVRPNGTTYVSYIYSASAKNQGNAAAGAFTISLSGQTGTSIGDSQLGTCKINGLGIGATASCDVWANEQVLSGKITETVDSRSEVAESNENNNQA